METAAVSAIVQDLHILIGRLEEEHRSFATDIEGLGNAARGDGSSTSTLVVPFTALSDSLTEHMLVEESEVYPAVMAGGLFDPSVSSIMQQHHDVAGSLSRMALALRNDGLGEFRIALEELSSVLRVHQPAEEEKVFPLLVPDDAGSSSSEPPNIFGRNDKAAGVESGV